MKITENMLQKWLAVPQDILHITNQKIIEVESFEKLNESTKLVIGKVLTCEKHPNADTLSLTTVDIKSEILSIVCGASNVAAGQYVIVAVVDSLLPGNFLIKPTTIRGVVSHGMICSLQELGFSSQIIPEQFKDGIYYFDQIQEIGQDALIVLGQDGFVMELGLTPNRSDLLSVLGYAYDLAAMTNQKIELPTYQIQESKKENPLKIEIETKGCGRYYARYIENLNVKPSPWWLQSALIANGIKPINNVVDISNYVLLEYGTPLHMFDAKKVKTNHILVRSAKKGEKVMTLDDQECTLVEGDVVITNGLEPIAIGGVMGLKNTMIDDLTKAVILEAAYFDPTHIRKTSHRLDLRSDSSLRFERGIDDTRVILGMERATALLIELADATISQKIAEHVLYKVLPKEIEISHHEINSALGLNLSMDEVVSYFKRYNYEVSMTQDVYTLKAPSYRNDIEIKADVIEEIARIYGLDHIPMQTLNDGLKGGLSLKQKRLRRLRHQLAYKGLNEVITYTLLKEEDVNRYRNIGKPVSILMPLSEDKKTLRQSLVNGLLETIRYNQARQIDDVAIFEIGHVFAEGIEKNVLGIAMSGKWHQNKWQKQAVNVDFYTLKGTLEDVFKTYNVAFSYVSSDEINTYHPGRQAKVMFDNNIIGLLAEVHPKETKQLDIEPTVVLEIDLDKLLQVQIENGYQAVSRFPSIFRDMAIVIKDQQTANELLTLIKQTASDILVGIDVFDVYQGSHIEEGFKSMAISLEFNHQKQTLDSETVDKMMKKIEKRLQFEFQAVIRN